MNNENIFYDKIFKNIFIRNIILNHLRLYKENNQVIIESTSELLNHPYREYITSIYYNLDEPLNESYIPSNVSKIIFGNSFNQFISPGDLHDNISTLIFLNLNYNKSISRNSLPKNLKSLFMFNFKFQFKNEELPPNLVNLKLLNFNQQILTGTLPNSIKQLKLKFYDYPIHNGHLPNALIKLKLGLYTHQLLPGVLPSSLESLSIKGYQSKELLSDSLPKNLTFLCLDKYDIKLKSGLLPQSITKLKLNLYNHKLKKSYLPPQLKILSLKSFNKNKLSPDILPNSIESLTLSSVYNHSLNKLPSSITNLSLIGDFLKKITISNFKTIPDTVKSLRVEFFNDRLKIGDISKLTITHLVLGANFDQILSIGVLPLSLKHLELGNNFTKQILPDSLHEGIETLVFGIRFYQDIKPNLFPSTIKKITFKNGEMSKYRDSYQFTNDVK